MEFPCRVAVVGTKICITFRWRYCTATHEIKGLILNKRPYTVYQTVTLQSNEPKVCYLYTSRVVTFGTSYKTFLYDDNKAQNYHYLIHHEHE